MSVREFTHREKKLVDEMIIDVSEDVALPKVYYDEARSIGWCTFLSIYQKHPAWFQWEGYEGWTHIYQEIYAELSALKTQEQTKYYTSSLDQPIQSESDTTLLNFVQTQQDDPHTYACLHDYMQRLPEDERQLAYFLCDGYSLEELSAHLHCSKETLKQSYARLQESLTQYLSF